MLNSTRTSDAASRLRHSWLQNQVLNKDVTDVVMLWHSGPWPALESEFEHRAEETIEIAHEMVQAFSPARLVRELTPLRRLPEDVRDKIADCVHETYLTTTDIQRRSEELAQVAAELKPLVRALRGAWSSPAGDEAEGALLAIWVKFRMQAELVHRFLTEVPRKVYLP